jgi:hypothetical protein
VRSAPETIASSSSASAHENLSSLSSVEHCGKRRIVTPEKQLPNAKKQRENSLRADGGSDSVSRNGKRGFEGTFRAPRDDSVQNRICQPMVEMHALDITEPLRKYVARLAGYSNVTSGGFAPAMSALKREGIMENAPQNRYKLSNKGLSLLPVVASPKSNDERHARFLELVSKIAGGSKDKAKRIFNVLKDREVHHTSDVAASTGYGGPTSGGFAPILSALKNLGLVRNAGKGLIRMTDLAFQDETAELAQSHTKVEDVGATITTDAAVTAQREAAESVPSNVYTNNDKVEDSGSAEPVPSNVKCEEEDPMVSTVGAAVTKSETAEPVPSNMQSNVTVENVTSYSTVASLSGPVELVPTNEHPSLIMGNHLSHSHRKTGSVHENICRALIKCRALGKAEPSRKLVALLADYPSVNSGFKKAFSALHQAGLVKGRTSTTAELTEYGIMTLPRGYPGLNIGPLAFVQRPKDNDEMHHYLESIIQEHGESPHQMIKVFRALTDGKVHSRANVATMANYPSEKKSGFLKVLSKLSVLGIIEYPDKNFVQLADVAFPLGRNVPSVVKSERLAAAIKSEVIDLTK